MIRKFSKILYLILLPFLTGCYEEFSPEIDVKPVLCMNAMITPGSPIEVSVTHTWVYTDMEASKDHTISDAVVNIYANGELKENTYLPQEGDRIFITADSHTYGHAEAEVTVPHAVPIKDVRFTPQLKSVWDPDQEHWAVNCEFRFDIIIELDIDDPANRENYYNFSEVTFNLSAPEDDPEYNPELYYGNDYNTRYENADTVSSGWWSTYFNSGSLNYDAEPIFGEHIDVYQTILIGDTNYGFTFFTDRQFQGDSYTLHLHHTGCSYRVTMQEWNPDIIDCGYILRLHTVSKSYYDWVNYKWQKEEGMLGEIGGAGLGEPLWGYSNVSTGAGVVAAEATSSYTLNLKDYIISLIQDRQE